MQNASVRFFYDGVRPSIPQRKALKSFLHSLARKEGKKAGEINYIFTTDEQLLQINRQYLDHHDYTDIITFQLNNPGEPLCADIYISTERVKENAAGFHTSFRHELHRVIFHGMLHLCGYKDKSEKDRKQMRQLEDKYLRLYFGR